MYGLWLFKELKTEYGYCKVDIYRKAFSGSAIEIGGFVGDSLSIALENLDTITAPVGKSVCSFAIYDTEQVEYDDLFSPDATALKVVVSTRVGSGAYVPRWSGYVTPDFFAENLSYRTPISISARDNIGYLNDVDFDLTATTITVREFIQSAFKRIAEDYPMSLSFVTQKQTAEGILAIDATISTTLLREMSWGEALETILHDLGLQMRWVDNNTIAVLDLSQIPEYYATQSFNFIEASGYREIVPAWRELSQEQDFGLKENFFEGWLREDNITFVKSVVMRPPNATNWTTDIAYYVPNNWGVARDIYTTDPSYYGSKFGKKIFFTGVSEQNPTTTYFSWRQQIQSSIVPMKMSFKAFNSVLSPSEKYANLTTPSGRRLVAYNPKDAFHGQKVGEYLQIGLKANVLLHSGLKTYILKSEWVEISDDGAGWQLDFTLPKVELSYVEGNQATAVEPREEEITINIATIPYDGELEFRIYGWYIVGKHNYWEDDYSVTNYTFDWLKCLAYINEPTFSFNTDEADSGRETNVMIAEAHNIKQEESYTFGQTFSNGGGLNAYAGALVGTDGNELIGFQRNADATNYNLLELVGREIIHFNKRNYNRLSGTIKNLNKEPLMFNRLFVREGKKYAPYNYSLNVISNEMNITSMQEVEPYETATFNTIDSQITTGGGTVSGGNNTILQYSEEAGNEKRLFELQTATEQEMSDAYVLVDKAGFPEARKVHVSELGGIDVRELEQYLESNGYATLKRVWEVDSANAVVRTTYNVVSEQEIISGRRASGSGSGGGGGISEITAQMVTDALGYVPYSSLNPAGYITSAALNGYAKTSDIPSSLPASDVYDWAKAATKPSYTASEVGALSRSGGTMTGTIMVGDFTAFGQTGGNFYLGTPAYPLLLRSNGTTTINSNTLIHSGNYSSYALPLSGGTLTGPLYIDSSSSSSQSLALRSNAADASGACRIQFIDANNAFQGYVMSGWGNLLLAHRSYNQIGVGDSGIWCSSDNGTTKNALIHSGDIGSQSVAGLINEVLTDLNNGSYGRIFTMTSGYGSTDGNKPDVDWVTGITLRHANNPQYRTQLAITTKEKLYLRRENGGTWQSWREIAFTDGNVASATKLQTARTIWGQSFDGTGDVTGAASFANGRVNVPINGDRITFNGSGYSMGILAMNNSNTYIEAPLASDSSSAAQTPILIGWRNGVYPFYISRSGNVLIGTTTDNGAKLQVSGGVTTYGTINMQSVGGIQNAPSISLYDNGVGYYVGSRNAGLGVTDGGCLVYAYGNTPISMHTNGLERMRVLANGNVLIGTTTDNGSGAKLQVNGRVQSGGYTLSNSADYYCGLMPNSVITSGGEATDIWLYNSTKILLYGSSIHLQANTNIAGNLTATGEVISTRRATSSDARLKDNINRLIAEDCLAIVRNLQPSSWDWKENGEHSLGFIAQDIEPLMPYAVTKIKDEVLGQRLNLQYDQFFAPIVGAIQCLDSEVEQLKKKVKYLENKLQEYGYNRY